MEMTQDKLLLSSESKHTGAVDGALVASMKAAKAAGQRNHHKITCIGPNIVVELNGERIIDWDMEPMRKIRDWATEGYIGLQNHGNGSPVYFRNIYLKEL